MFFIIIRYVGDILAWLHQAVAGEKELLQSLLRRTNVKGKCLLLYSIYSVLTEWSDFGFAVVF